MMKEYACYHIHMNSFSETLRFILLILMVFILKSVLLNYLIEVMKVFV